MSIKETITQTIKNPTVISCQVEVVESLTLSFFISYYCCSLLFVSGLSASSSPSTKVLYKPMHLI